jgi:polysaccharide pyruvyl transferase WcaK-like protein
MRIALWNGSSLDNLGDRLIDRVSRCELDKRLADASFETFSPWPSPAVPPVRIDRDGRWSGERQFDAIVIGGGALLIGPPFVHPSLQTCFLGPYPDRFRDPSPIVWSAVASDGQPSASFAEPWRAYVRAACERLSYRSVRDRSTLDLLDSCGVADQISVVPDPVMLVSTPRPRDPRREGRRRIGFVPGMSGHSEWFMSQLEAPCDDASWNAEVCVRLPKGKLSIEPALLAERLRTFVAGMSESTDHLRRRDDLEVCAFGPVYGDDATVVALSQALGCPIVHLADPNGADAIEWIASLDCLIASRFHACVLALAVGTPFVAVDPYLNDVTATSKIRELMADAGLLDAYVPLASLLEGGVSLDQRVEDAIGGRDRQAAAHAASRKAATAHFDRLAHVISTQRE